MRGERGLQQRQYRPGLRVGIGHVLAGQARHDADHVRMRFGDVEPGVVGADRLLDEQDRVAACQAREDLLRPLPDEVPAQVRVDDEREALQPLVLASTGDHRQLRRRFAPTSV